MKTNTTFWGARALAAGLAISVLVGTVGCASRGYESANATSNNLQQAASELATAQIQIDQVTAVLQQMVNQPTGDLRPLFAEYREGVNELEQTLQELDQLIVRTERDRQRYFDQWDRQTLAMQNPEMRTTSLQRQDEVAQQFADVQQSYAQARQDFRPLMRDLHDIQRMLSVDLTASGIENIGSMMPQVREGAPEASQALEQLAQDFREISNRMSPDTLGTQMATD